MVPRLAELNLNLLLVLDALLRERGVTRAGRSIGLSQPASSAALAQLRRFFHDELLVRNGRGYQLTPLALGLAGPVAEIITLIERTVAAPEAFDPARAEREFSIAVSDYVQMTLVPALLLPPRRSHARCCSSGALRSTGNRASEPAAGAVRVAGLRPRPRCPRPWRGHAPPRCARDRARAVRPRLEKAWSRVRAPRARSALDAPPRDPRYRPSSR